MSKVTVRQLNLLAPYLEGETPTHTNADDETGEETREWNLLCPLHEGDGDSHRRSASLNVDKGLFYCFVCGGMPVTALIRRKEEWLDPGVRTNGHKPHLNGSAPDRRQRTLTVAMVDGWHSALVAAPGALQWLRQERGLTLETVQKYKIGLDNGKLYTIPVWSPEGEIWNVRYYDPRPGESRRKIWGETGYNSPPRLFPMSVLGGDPNEIIICEGEWDTLKLLQHGYTAITRTGTADTWENSWSELFTGMTVFLCHDRDDKGQRADRKLARLLHRIADVRMVELPYPLTDKHGKDVTDFMLENDPREFQQLLDNAKPFTIKKVKADDVETVTVLDTFDARRVGEPVRVVVTIKGRKEPGYTIPRKVNLVCSQDVGQKCEICPMRAARGEATVDILPDDPMVLGMIEATHQAVSQIVAESYGVPGGKCVKLLQDVEEHQGVEVLFARPALDYSDGSETDLDKAATYKNITITSVGRHDTLANNTVAATGALQPNPRSQRNEFLAHQIEVLETSVDGFDLDEKTVALLKRFQGRRPLHKLAEIDKSLAEHVTRIHGRPEMHALMDLTFHSVLSFKFAGEVVERGWLDSLVVGDTRTGKSLAAQRLIRHYGAGELISCEASTFAGIVGGVQQMNGKDWAVTWGVIPQNDRRAVVLDEISGLTPEDIAQMSDIRSSGQAKLIKVVQESTWARARLLWLGNPRNATMANYTYGVDAIKPLIGNAEDIARFDLAMAVTLFDVPSEVINVPGVAGELRYTDEACHALLLWAWTRKLDDVVFTPDAERRIFDAANEMGRLYIEDPPLIQAANVRIKIARVAAALAARTFSTDASFEKLVVAEAHVADAVRFINLIYGMQAFGYRERSREILSDRYEAERNKEEIAQYLKGRPLLAKHLRNAGKFRRQDLEELLHVGRDEANGIINRLFEARMVRRVLGDIYVEPTLHALLRETKW